MELIELHLPSSFTNLPPHLHTTKGLPPHLLTTLMKAFEAAIPSVSPQRYSTNLIIYDILAHSVPSLASSLNIPAIFFSIIGATSASFFFHQFKRHGIDFPFPNIFLRKYFYIHRLSPNSNSEEGNVRAIRKVTDCLERSSSIILIKSSEAIEKKYIDYFSDLTGKKIVPVGPLLQYRNDPIKEVEQMKIMQWLDCMKEDTLLKSFVYISFGSECYLSKEELEELAYGIELSNVNFIWVVRFPVEEMKVISVEEALPGGFIDRVVKANKGMVIDGWVPQAKILAHERIGGYVCHCGWGSTVESMYFGVPIIAMPMQHDNPINARLVEEVGVGVEVLRDEVTGKYKREEIARVIKEVVGEKSGEEIRRKAMEVSQKLRVEGKEAPGSAVDELTKLCQMNIGGQNDG